VSDWSLEAGRLELQPGLMEGSVLKTKEILLQELEKVKKSKESTIQRYIEEKVEKISKEMNLKKKEIYIQDKDKLQAELKKFLSKVEDLKNEIMNDEQLKKFVNRIQWEFKQITAEDSLKR
jgi:C-terminal processing protease CtpA/Prc